MNEMLKAELCRGARLLYRRGLCPNIAGHISIRIGPFHMLANRFGPSFAVLTPDDLLTLTLDGTVVDDPTPSAGVSARTEGRVNETIRLHGVIHRQIPELTAVVHCHPPAVTTFSTLRSVPEVYDQESCFLAGQVGIVEEDYPGLASSEERVLPIAEALKRYRALILPNHGAVTRGSTLAEAVLLMLGLEGMAMRHLAVAAAGRATGIKPRPIAQEVARQTREELSRLDALPLFWEDQMAQLRATDPMLFALENEGN